MTYSIVARDPATGQLGVAVQSHAFSVGPMVPWARAVRVRTAMSNSFGVGGHDVSLVFRRFEDRIVDPRP